MIAAIYARKSTTQDDVEDDAKSVTRQMDSARAFIITNGWTLDDAHVYTDEKVSGALFANRAEFQRLMRDAAAHAFEAVVFYDLDRFGRHAHQTMVALHTLADLGVSVWDCSTGGEVDLSSFEGRVTTTLRAEFAQQFRDDIRKKTRAGMRYKAAKGWMTGGKVFGYDHVCIAKGHHEWRINEHEKQVVIQIYTRCAAGEGARTIAGVLNRAGVPKPRAQPGRKEGWSVSTIRAVLRRPMYRGDLVYGRTAKAYDRELKRVYPDTTREKGQIPMPEDTWIQPHDESLRIIDPVLAEKVDAKLDNRRTRYLASKAKGDGNHKTHGRYLLSGGMLLCPQCGGHFEARKNPWKPSAKTAALLPPNCRGGHPDHVYICSTRRRKPGVCTNTLALPIDETDDTVLSVVEGELLETDFIRELLSLVEHAPDETAWLTAERDRLQKEVDRLVAAIAAGVPPESVAPLVRTNQTEIAKLDVRLRMPRVPRLDHERLRAALEQRAEQWKADLRREPAIARLMLRRLVGPLTLHDEADRPEWCRWKAQPTTELLDGLAPTLQGTSPAGFEPAFWP
jgi:DNA invertase Pin-like site-specific DNA recombinase